MQKIFLDTINHKNEKNISPVWIMRQAGRYLPEYMEVRKNMNDFLDLCYSPEKAAEVTLQPIKRFDLDAAIIFSDILVILDILGFEVKFKESLGPVIRNNNFQDIKINKNSDRIEKIEHLINIVKSKIAKNKVVIGFAGSPWTVVSYVFQDIYKKEKFEQSQKLAINKDSLILNLIDLITEQTIIHLSRQIEAGVEVIQLFESWAGILSEEEFKDFVIKPNKVIISYLKEKYPHIPIIGFPKGAGYLYDKYIEELEIKVIGVDQFVPIDKMRTWQNQGLITQGNINPLVLFSTKDVIKKKIDQVKEKILPNKHIFNLGHGILPNTPIENVEFFIKEIRSYE